MFVHTLFEVSWEVCNKVGGIHTVVSTKARSMVERFGDDYITLGPMLPGEGNNEQWFTRVSGFEEFEEECAAEGFPCRLGRWNIPGNPLTIQVDFSPLYERKNEILAELWENFRVDSIEGGWDYIEPVMFGHAAGRVIAKWWQAYVQPRSNRAVAHFHEWMTASGALFLKREASAIGTVFTTHATMLGRAISSQGSDPVAAAVITNPEDLAARIGVRAKHSMEGVAARESDVFTTVSEITAGEAAALHNRRPDPLLPNGMDPEVLEAIVKGHPKEKARDVLSRLARCFFGENLDDALYLCISGRYEFHNKGIDLLLDALADMDKAEGRKVVCFVLVPAGQSGMRPDLQQCMLQDKVQPARTEILCTHNLIDPDQDPVVRRTRELGLADLGDHRVRVLQVPVYLHGDDGLINIPYEAVLRGMDLSAFPSFYEPWGYTPQESLAVGVPTVTTDCAGFGRWLNKRFAEEGLGDAYKDHVLVLSRKDGDYDRARKELAQWLEDFCRRPRDPEVADQKCRELAAWTSWSELFPNYEKAYQNALRAATARSRAIPSLIRGWRNLKVRHAHRAHPPKLQVFEVSVALPAPLADLERLSRNLWWTWNPRAQRLFEDLSPGAWESSGHNPVLMLKHVRASELESKANDKDYLARLRKIVEEFDAYIAHNDARYKSLSSGEMDPRHPIAYFCAEFGIHESFPIYSGGLGVLAGDHLKSASDLGLPFLAVGLFYRRGYLRQKLTATGDQIAEGENNLPAHLPLELVTDVDRKPVEIRLPLPNTQIMLRAWRTMVGRVPLYLLDTDLPANRPEDRGITSQLYAGDTEHRLRQEIVLGRGGVRLLHQLGIHPAAYHINEGHAAFAPLERVARVVRDQGLTFEEAATFTRSTTVFTTHTPIPAGHDRFPEDLVRRYFSDVSQWAGLSWERFWALGADNGGHEFNMTHLACRLSGMVNGVSRLHGEVSRGLLSPLWPQLLQSEVPVDSVTNGVHLPTWTSPRITRLLGVEGRPVEVGDLQKDPEKIKLKDLHEVRRANKQALGEFVKQRLTKVFRQRHDSPALLGHILDGLDPDALWIGFARRFVPYKRANLLFRYMDRLKELVNSTEQPVRFLFAGKAHPRDGAAQETLKEVFNLARTPEFAGKVIFVDGYDMALARHLVAGVDVWLNNPIRPLEASGTSGMKVAANGGQNLSVLDGWWAEADTKSTGWVIGEGEEYAQRELQDEMEAHHLMQLLEEEVIPMFYDLDKDGLPRRWLERCRISMTRTPAVFNTDRMVSEYFEKGYGPSHQAFHQLRAMNHEPLREIAVQHSRIRTAFPNVRIVGASVQDLDELHVLSEVKARVDVDLGGLRPEDLVVEAVLGPATPEGELTNVTLAELKPDEAEPGSTTAYYGTFRFDRSGTHGYGIRVRARQTRPWDRGLDDLVLWAASEVEV